MRLKTLRRSFAPCLTMLAVAAISLAIAAAVLAQETVPAAEEPAAPAEAGGAPDQPTADQPAAGESPVDSGEEARPAQSDEDLALAQQQLADKFKHLEQVLLRMAELTAATDPHRAALLRKVVTQSKDDLIGVQFERLVELLRQERLGPAVANQKDLHQDLTRLLEMLLSENRSQTLKSELARYREYLKRVNKLIKDEQSLQDQTSRGADANGLARRQGQVAEKAGQLSDDIRENEEAKPSEGQEGDGEGAEGEPQQGEGQGEGEGQRPGEGEDEGQKPGEGEEQKPGEGQGEGQKPGEGEGQKPGEGEGQKPGEGEGQKPGEGEGQKPGEGEGQKPGEGEGQKPGEGEGQKPGEGEGQKPGEGQGQGQGQGQGEGGGEGGQGKPDENPARKRIEAAEQKMRQAQEKLEKAKREGAVEDQEAAIRELEQAKAELERILRQLREEQIERTLAQLEARFRKMLEMQIEVYEGTLRLDKVPETERDADDRIEAGRLSRKESAIGLEAEKALTLLREEGTAVAMPEAVGQMRDDILQVATRLAEAKVGDITQGIEEDIIAALQEMIEALEKAQQELEQQKGEPPPPGEPSDPPLIDVLAELKMLRALQMRVNTRTQRYSRLVEGEQAIDPDLLEALQGLAEREQRIFEATKDISQGKNQ